MLTRRNLSVALVGWIWARVCVAAGFLIAHQLTPDPALAAKEDFPLPRGLLAWDGFFYEKLASGWYGGTPTDGVRFFPGYPALGRLLSPLALGHVGVSLVAINNAAALLGAVVVAQLVREVLRDDDTADRSAWMVAVIPAALALVLAYSEGLALCATAATLLALHRRAFAWAGAFAAAACLVRPTGLLLLVPIGIEVVRARPRPVPAITAVLAPLAGFATSLAVIWQATGSWTAAFDAQQPIRGDVRNPLIRAAEAVWGLRYNTDTELVPFVVLWFVLLGVAVWKRQPRSWIAFSAVTLLVACSSQTIDSIGRYGLLAVPLVIALAQWADRRWRSVLVACVSSVGMVVMTAQVLQGRIVP